jgi:hypothetical protein
MHATYIIVEFHFSSASIKIVMISTNLQKAMMAADVAVPADKNFAPAIGRRG